MQPVLGFINDISAAVSLYSFFLKCLVHFQKLKPDFTKFGRKPSQVCENGNRCSKNNPSGCVR